MKKYLNKQINYDDLVGFIDRIGKSKIELSGLLGEPLFYSHIFELITYLNSIDVLVKIHTNFNIKIKGLK